MALQFQLRGGELQNMALINVPVFFAASPQDFFERLQADVPDPATGKRDPEKLKAYVAKHPEYKGRADWFATHNSPTSYAEAAYYSVHAFKFIDAGKHAQRVKWRFEPRDGAKFLRDEDMASAPKDFLWPRFLERVQKGPVVWDMIVSLGEKGDPVDNQTLIWPATRREIKAGALTINKASADAAGCDGINFDPNLVSAGIETSPDPILAFRSPAYAVSYRKRLDEKGS
jgi:catalase